MRALISNPGRNPFHLRMRMRIIRKWRFLVVNTIILIRISCLLQVDRLLCHLQVDGLFFSCYFAKDWFLSAKCFKVFVDFGTPCHKLCRSPPFIAVTSRFVFFCVLVVVCIHVYFVATLSVNTVFVFALGAFE